LWLNSYQNRTVGLWDTIAGGNCSISTPGVGSGNFLKNETPSNALDGDPFTKYRSLGGCEEPHNASSSSCGLNTGLQFTFKIWSPLVVALKFRTANDFLERDPITISLEGSNQDASVLCRGSSWTLIYAGSSGLHDITGRWSFGTMQLMFDNVVWYRNYRLLVTSKRNVSNSVQYADVELFGYYY
jgi:hypothetical protein